MAVIEKGKDGHEAYEYEIENGQVVAISLWGRQRVRLGDEIEDAYNFADPKPATVVKLYRAFSGEHYDAGLEVFDECIEIRKKNLRGDDYITYRGFHQINTAASIQARRLDQAKHAFKQAVSQMQFAVPAHLLVSLTADDWSKIVNDWVKALKSHSQPRS